MMIKWNQIREGNVHVDDGCMGWWATVPPEWTARQALDAYMSTADYSEARAHFRVTVTMLASGDMASTVFEPKGDR
jgi:hypothetical protein